MDKLAQLERAIGVDFIDRRFLEAALAHSSFLNEQPGKFEESNERLEFLGDAILDAAVTEELYRRHPTWAEGELTHARAAVVKRDTLAVAGQRLQLGEYLYLGKGEEQAGGRSRSNNLGAALEAVIGALFLDQGMKRHETSYCRSCPMRFPASTDRRRPRLPSPGFRRWCRAEGSLHLSIESCTSKATTISGRSRRR